MNPILRKIYATPPFSGVLPYLAGEAGTPRVPTLLKEAEGGEHNMYVSLITLGEVLYITERETGLVKAQQTLAALEQLPIQFVPVSRATGLAAAHLQAQSTVADADAFAVVTARITTRCS